MEDIWDAVARHAGQVAGIKAAFGSTAGDATGISPIPEAVTDGPVAVVDYGGTTIDHGGGSVETMVHLWNIVLWMPMGNGTREAAVKTLAPMFARFHAHFDANVGLSGVLGGAGQALIVLAGPFEDEEIETGTFLTQVITVQTTHYVHSTHAIGS